MFNNCVTLFSIYHIIKCDFSVKYLEMINSRKVFIIFLLLNSLYYQSETICCLLWISLQAAML